MSEKATIGRADVVGQLRSLGVRPGDLLLFLHAPEAGCNECDAARASMGA